jgi:hypothetical protein
MLTKTNITLNIYLRQYHLLIQKDIKKCDIFGYFEPFFNKKTDSQLSESVQ